ncbi:MAG: ATP-binding protein, partial [Spirochaetia bacterium]|nr:ATP-binding protein [Spirochaetia bacterium]
LLGFNLGGKRWPRDPERDKKIDGKQIALFDSIEALAGDSMPHSLSASVQRAFNVGIIAVVSIRRTNQSFGDFTLIFKQDEAFRNHELALILADYVGILIERRRITAHLEENDALFTQFLKHSPVYAFIKEVKEHDSFTIRMSDNYSEMIGRPTSELLGKGMREMFPADFAEKMIKDDFSVVRSGKVVELDEQLNGRAYTTIKFPIYQQERKLLAGYTIDVTEREASKKKLAENEAQTRTLIANLPGFVYRCRDDRDWTMIYISDGCAGITGYGAQDLLLNSSRSFSELIEPGFKEKIWESVQSALRSATSFEEEYPIIHRDGTERWIWERGRGIYAPNGELQYIEGFITDITRRKNDEARIRELNEKLFLSKKNEALGTLVAGVAHNVNNFLAAIMAAASCGTADSKKSPEIEAFQRIDSLCGRGRELLKSLMKFAKPSLETMIPINIKAIVEEVVTIIKHSTFNQITIAFTAPKDQLWVFGDPGALNSVFMNLCINAVDAMPKGGSLNIALSLIDRKTIGVSVEDTGIGIGKEALTHVFEPFFTTKEPGKGTGLGLSTSFGTIKAHNGSISIESEVGKGTIVHVRLPKIDSPSQEAGISANLSSQSHLSSEKGDGNRISPLKIALVDDDDDVLFLTCKMLEKAGHSVTPLSGGAECLSFITGAKQTGHSPDVIIIDQNMPKMNGVQTIERLKEISPKIPILLSSGQPDIQEWDSVKQANVAVISKPFNVGEIQAALAAISTQKG